MEQKEKYETSPVWGVLELFGHKVECGKITVEEVAGAPMYRLDVPPTADYPGFTRFYSPQAVYSLTYVSEDAGLVIAQRINANPVTIYVPELASLVDLKHNNEQLSEAVDKMRAAISKVQALGPGRNTHGYDDERDTF